MREVGHIDLVDAHAGALGRVAGGRAGIRRGEPDDVVSDHRAEDAVIPRVEEGAARLRGRGRTVLRRGAQLVDRLAPADALNLDVAPNAEHAQAEAVEVDEVLDGSRGRDERRVGRGHRVNGLQVGVRGRLVAEVPDVFVEPAGGRAALAEDHVAGVDQEPVGVEVVARDHDVVGAEAEVWLVAENLRLAEVKDPVDPPPGGRIGSLRNG